VERAPVGQGAPCGEQPDYWFRLNPEKVTPQHFRYIGLHRPNVVKKESLAWFSNQTEC
jgi:hypothetical protein